MGGRRGGRRWIVLATIGALVLTIGFGAQPDPGTFGFPIGGLRELVDDWRIAALPIVGGLPVQARGGATAGPSRVSAAETSAHRGAGRAPGKGIGALPEFVAPGLAGR